MSAIDVIKAVPQTIITVEKTALAVMKATGTPIDNTTKLGMAMTTLQQVADVAGVVDGQWVTLAPAIEGVIALFVNLYNVIHPLFQKVAATAPAA
jgi:hypothetical protein